MPTNCFKRLLSFCVFNFVVFVEPKKLGVTYMARFE